METTKLGPDAERVRWQGYSAHRWETVKFEQIVSHLMADDQIKAMAQYGSHELADRDGAR